MSLTKATSRVLADQSVGLAQLSATAVPVKLGEEIGPFSFRNKIINGSLDVWQRGTSFSISNTTIYTADRWRADLISTSGTATVTVETFNSNIGGRPDGITVNNYLRYNTSSNVVLNSTVGTSQLSFLLENCRNYIGKTFTLSFWARASQPNARVGHHFNAFFGTGATPESTSFNSITRQHIPLPTVWTKFVYTFTVPNTTGVTFGTDFTSSFNLSINFGITGNAATNAGYSANVTPIQNCNYDVAQLQLEEGTIATPFEQRPISLELSLCQRYYEVMNLFGMLGITYRPNGDTRGGVPFKVQKRVAPTVSPSEVGVQVIAFSFAGEGINLNGGQQFSTTQDWIRWSYQSNHINIGNAAGGGGVYVWGDNNIRTVGLEAEL